jgi:hypothetical protein
LAQLDIERKKNNTEILIDELYLKYLKRHADKEGLTYYTILLEQKQNTLEEIKTMFINSSEYKNLEISDRLYLGNSPLSLTKLESLLPHAKNYDKKLLLKIINIARKYFMWFTRHSPRLIEYPWVVSQIKDFSKKSFLEIGAGLSPLPLFLAEQGAFVITIDNSKIIRKTTDDPSTFNEWGYFDYSLLHKNIKSFNIEIDKINFPNNYFDYIFSVSVIEHIHAKSHY